MTTESTTHAPIGPVDLAAEREAAGETNVRVYADVLVSVNGRPLRRFVPMDLDLASVEDAFHMEHILLPE